MNARFTRFGLLATPFVIQEHRTESQLRLWQAQRSAGKNEVYPDFILSHQLDPKPGEKRRLSGKPMPISDLRF
jgi:hypothetical protein